MTLFIIDDDPTGAQAQADVTLLLAWGPGLLAETLSSNPAAIHLMTNSRALDETAAYTIVREAAEAAAASTPEARIVLRGDSTLRGHLFPEYRAVADALSPDRPPPLVLAPALPTAGRVTRGGTHWLVRDGRCVPAGSTEYATDSRLGYKSSRLVEWAEERSEGFFLPERSREVPLAELRATDGALRFAAALVAAASEREPAVVVPDAENDDDLEVIAKGLDEAWDVAHPIVRCSPALASVLAGAAAKSTVPLPQVDDALLVVVGSHVPMTTAQLDAVLATRADALVEVDALELATGDDGAIADATERARDSLAARRLAIVATTRDVPPRATTVEAGMRIADSLAAIVDRLRDDADVLLSKGGITSAINVEKGLKAETVKVVGPVQPGVSLWLAAEPGGHDRPVIVFPGNVGGPTDLCDLIDRLMGA